MPRIYHCTMKLIPVYPPDAEQRVRGALRLLIQMAMENKKKYGSVVPPRAPEPKQKYTLTIIHEKQEDSDGDECE